MYLTTPLGIIPIDIVGFYMIPPEMEILQNCGAVQIKQAGVTVVPQGIDQHLIRGLL